MNFHVKATSIHGVKIITYDSFEDERGFIFSLIKIRFVRHKLPSLITTSLSIIKNVLRGIHYDSQTTACHLSFRFNSSISCRYEARLPTYLQHLEVNISSNLLTSLLIPLWLATAFM